MAAPTEQESSYNMKRFLILLSACGLTIGMANAQNLLSNGDFDLPGDGNPATDWTPWSWNSGWANTEIAAWGSPGGTYHLAVGAPGDGGGGYFQILPATPGISYTLTVDSGADAWWLPTGTMTMFFLDDTEAELGQAGRNTVDPAVYGNNNDIPHPWETYSLSATSPVGTTQIKVEFAANNATGSVGFDNAVLVVPEPASAGLLLLGSVVLLGCRWRQDR
jgi:hypothetical protein